LKNTEITETASRQATALRALTMILHWFATDKNKAVKRIIEECQTDFSWRQICLAVAECVKEEHIIPIHSPEKTKKFLEQIFNITEDRQLIAWDWWHLINDGSNPEGYLLKQKEWWKFLGVRENRELLLYCQREYLHERFKDYDPARKDLWKEHNRPWDFDHIFPSFYTYNRKDDAKYMAVCHKWCNTIGNLRAWPFEENRSDQKDLPGEKIKSEEELKNSFIEKTEMEGFSPDNGDKVRHEKDISLKFIRTCLDRFIRIYGHWYKQNSIDELQKAIDNEKKEVLSNHSGD